MPRTIHLDYGRDGLDISVPEHALRGVLSLNPAPAIAWAERGVRDALLRPTGCPPLAARARGAGSACVVISDITRPVPNKAILSELLPIIEMGGVPREEITILIATGTHRASTPAEIEEMVGAEIAAAYQIVSHDARDPETHRFLGETPRGVPIWVDTRFLDADLRVSAALIEPHFMAGFSGGRKSVCPGICGMETVKVWHGPHFIGHPNATMGVIEGNPVHEDSLYIAGLAGLHFICDVTLDEQRRVTGVHAGDYLAAWMKGVETARCVSEAAIDEPVDIVVTSCAGYPLDLTFYQAVKGMVGALPILRDGGTIIIAARCEEGIGGPEFTETLLAEPDLDAFVEKTRQPGFFIPDQWEIHELQRAVSRAEVMMYSEGIKPDLLSRCFVTPIASVEEGVRRAMEKHGPGASIAVIPKGPYVTPVLAA